MSPCGHAILDVWRRLRLEFTVELPLLRERWKTILLGAIFQYVHAMATQLAHRMHRPLAQPLHDVGFDILPELGLANEWVSELIFTSLFVSFVLWTFSPFIFARKRFYTAVLYSRILTVLVVCQTLRIASFTVTQLPGPNYHCREGESTAVREMPKEWWGHIAVDVKRQATHGCGDLIFSSHTTFALVGVLTYTEYGTHLATKVITWLAVGVLSILIVASRKHYSVDVLIAWYVVPLVFWTLHRRWTTKRNTVIEGPGATGEFVYNDIEAGVELQEVVLESVEVQQPGQPVKDTGMKGSSPGKAQSGNSKVGTVIGIIANGFSNLQHNGTNGHSGHGHQTVNNQLGRLNGLLSGGKSTTTGTLPGSPTARSGGGGGGFSGDEGGNLWKSSPLSSMRPRSNALSTDSYQPMLRDEEAEWSTRAVLDSSRSSSVASGQSGLSCSTNSMLCHIS